MLGWVAEYLVIYLINGPWRGEHVRGFAYTDEFVQAARLPLVPDTMRGGTMHMVNSGMGPPRTGGCRARSWA